MKMTQKKKLKPMIQVGMASPKEVPHTAYVHVTNAITIATMAVKVNKRATMNKKTNCWNALSDIMKWTNTAQSERTMAMAFVITNARKDAFLVRIAVPWLGLSSLL